MTMTRQLSAIIIHVFVLLLVFIKPLGAGEGTGELRGIFRGKSYKAKLISLQAGDKTLLVPYDEKTEGLDEVVKGDNILLRYVKEGEKKKVLEVIPELVQLPVGVTEITAEELLAMIKDKSQAGKYLLVDCRPADFYAETHLATAVSIPWTEAKEVKLAALPSDKGKLLIFYCLGSTCLLGPNSAAMAVEAGYTNVRVLLSELSEWQESGGRLYSADRYVIDGNVVLVDIRNLREPEAGHVPGAVNISAGDVSEAEYDFPAKKSAPVIVYGDGSDQAAAVETIKGWGFHQVSEIEGGYEGWVGRGNPVREGKMSSQIKWQRRLGEGEVSIEDFKKVAFGNNDNAVVIDVRTFGEAGTGGFEKAIRIPLTEIERRLAEIPEDKDVYLHCATGSRAKMAWSYLKQHRSRVLYLKAKVTCKKGKCRVRP